MHALTSAVASRGPARPACRSRCTRAGSACRGGTAAVPRHSCAAGIGARSARPARRGPIAVGGGETRLVVRFRPPRAGPLLGDRGHPVRGGALLVAGTACRARPGGDARAVHRGRLLPGTIGATRLATRPGTGRRLGAGGPGAAVRAHRLSLEPLGQRLGDSRGGRRRVDPACRLDRRAWADAGDTAARGRGDAPLAMACGGCGPARRLGRRRTGSAPAGHPAAAADCRAGAGQCRAGPEMEPGPRRQDLPALPGPVRAGAGIRARAW